MGTYFSRGFAASIGMTCTFLVLCGSMMVTKKKRRLDLGFFFFILCKIETNDMALSNSEVGLRGLNYSYDAAGCNVRILSTCANLTMQSAAMYE